jgi:NADH:ubiquinone oxidoreductase subunit 2 (subunit N)
MLFYPTFFETATTLVFYMLTYNLSLFLVFWTLSQYSQLTSKTIYNFADLRLYPAASATLTVMFFSMAGVPPFLGFFAKLLILLSLLHSGFFLIYIAFFVLLLFSLYFYMQNMRFLHTTATPRYGSLLSPRTRTTISYVY